MLHLLSSSSCYITCSFQLKISLNSLLVILTVIKSLCNSSDCPALTRVDKYLRQTNFDFCLKNLMNNNPLCPFRSSNSDPGTPPSESLSAKEHAAILKEKKLLDIPKLMDICAIYGHDNPDLTKRLVGARSLSCCQRFDFE